MKYFAALVLMLASINVSSVSASNNIPQDTASEKVPTTYMTVEHLPLSIFCETLRAAAAQTDEMLEQVRPMRIEDYARTKTYYVEACSNVVRIDNFTDPNAIAAFSLLDLLNMKLSGGKYQLSLTITCGNLNKYYHKDREKPLAAVDSPRMLSAGFYRYPPTVHPTYQVTLGLGTWNNPSVFRELFTTTPSGEIVSVLKTMERLFDDYMKDPTVNINRWIGFCPFSKPISSARFHGPIRYKAEGINLTYRLVCKAWREQIDRNRQNTVINKAVRSHVYTLQDFQSGLYDWDDWRVVEMNPDAQTFAATRISAALKKICTKLSAFVPAHMSQAQIDAIPAGLNPAVYADIYHEWVDSEHRKFQMDKPTAAVFYYAKWVLKGNKKSGRVVFAKSPRNAPEKFDKFKYLELYPHVQQEAADALVDEETYAKAHYMHYKNIFNLQDELFTLKDRK